MADEAVAILERSVTERLNVHRRELDDLDDQVADLRDDIGKALAATNDRLAQVEQGQAVQSVLMERLIQSNSRLIAAAITLTVAVIGSAAGIIILERGAP